MVRGGQILILRDDKRLEMLVMHVYVLYDVDLSLCNKTAPKVLTGV